MQRSLVQDEGGRSQICFIGLRRLATSRIKSWCFEDKIILPTGEQGQSCVRVCQYLTNFYRPIELVRFDERTGIVYIFAGEDLQVVIYRDGKWRFR